MQLRDILQGVKAVRHSGIYANGLRAWWYLTRSLRPGGIFRKDFGPCMCLPLPNPKGRALLCITKKEVVQHTKQKGKSKAKVKKEGYATPCFKRIHGCKQL